MYNIIEFISFLFPSGSTSVLLISFPNNSSIEILKMLAISESNDISGDETSFSHLLTACALIFNFFAISS